MSQNQKWEIKLNKARDLRKQGAALLHERIGLLVACFEDEEFKAWCAQTDTPELDYLDSELADLQLDFLTMQGIYKRFPKAEDWKKHGLRRLHAMAVEDEKAEKDAEKEPIQKQPGPRYKELYEEAAKRIEILTTEIDLLKQIMSVRKKKPSSAEIVEEIRIYLSAHKKAKPAVIAEALALDAREVSELTADSALFVKAPSGIELAA